MESSINIGIIGCGEMGQIHARCIKEIGTATIRGFCDADESKAQKLIAYSPEAHICSDPQELLDDDSIDAVYVCTHNDSHAGLGIAAAKAGKHVMMEKPVAMSLKQCDELQEAVERSGIHFMTAFKLRYYPTVQKVREFIPSPLICIAQMSDERWPDTFWGNDPLRGGGNVLSQGCHTADLMCFLTGSEPVKVYAAGGNYHHPGLDITDALTATVTFENGATASLVIADIGITPHISKLSFQLMDGSRSAHLYDRLKQAFLWDGKREEHLVDFEEFGFLNENKEFLNVISGKAKPTATLRHGVRATVLLLKAIESAKTGQPQPLQF